MYRGGIGRAKKSLKHTPQERLRWRVLKTFHVLPGEQRAKEMTAREYLYCLLQQWLDEEEKLERLCPTCRAQAQEKRCACCGAPLSESSGMKNASFDMERYCKMKEGKCV